MGPITALQVTGSAKELVREIPPDQLANGGVDPVTRNQISGLMMLVQTLARRYMPLEQQMSTSAVSDFMNFDRISGESIDALLVRFDVLRARAQQRGGLGIIGLLGSMRSRQIAFCSSWVQHSHTTMLKYECSLTAFVGKAEVIKPE